MSADGRSILIGTANALIAGDTNNVTDLYLFDRPSGAYSMISVTPGGDPSVSGARANSDITPDGRWVAFGGRANELVAGGVGAMGDILVRDLTSGLTSQVSRGLGGAASNGGSSYPRISVDGRFVAFQSVATNLVPGDTNGEFDLFVVDRVSSTTVHASVGATGVQANARCYWYDLSGDGRVSRAVSILRSSRDNRCGASTGVATARARRCPT